MTHMQAIDADPYALDRPAPGTYDDAEARPYVTASAPTDNTNWGWSRFSGLYWCAREGDSSPATKLRGVNPAPFAGPTAPHPFLRAESADARYSELCWSSGLGRGHDGC